MIDAALREDGRFEQLKMLGKGSFGCVCQARHVENDEIVAIKLLPRTEVLLVLTLTVRPHSVAAALVRASTQLKRRIASRDAQ